MLEMSDDLSFEIPFKPAVMYLGFRYRSNPFGIFADGLTPILLDLTETLAKSDTPDHIVQLTCGNSSCVALTFSGKVFTFGVDRFGQLGYAKTKPSSKAHLIEALYTRCTTPPTVRVVISKIATGKNHTCTLDENGRVFMFGSNSHGQCGFETGSDKYGDHYSYVGERARPFERKDSEVSATSDVASPRLLAGRSACYYRLLHLTLFINNSYEPRLVKFTSPIATDIACGASHTVAILKGVVYSWGKGSMLGQGSTRTSGDDSHIPKLLKAAREVKFVSVACGMEHSVASTSEGKVWCWGSNEFGQCGSPDAKILTSKMTRHDREILAVENRLWEESLLSLPVEQRRAEKIKKRKAVERKLDVLFKRNGSQLIKDAVNIVNVKCGAFHSMALSDEGEVWCWGWNKYVGASEMK